MILIFGGGGYIGSQFCAEMRRRLISFAVGYQQEFIRRGHLPDGMKISLVINCAAFVTKPSVDLCDDHREETLRGNLILPALLRAACAEREIPLMHVSTGCLYNGDNGGHGWSERDPAQLRFDTGAGWYVGTKHLAEEIVRQYAKTYCCRVRIPFDHRDGPRNYLSKLMRFDKIVSEPNSLSHRGDFVRACLDLFEKQAAYGIYNVVNPGFITARRVTEMLQTLGHREYQFWPTAEFLKTARCLKSNCVLNTDKLKAAGIVMRPVEEAIADSIAGWQWEKTT